MRCETNQPSVPGHDFLRTGVPSLPLTQGDRSADQGHGHVVAE